MDDLKIEGPVIVKGSVPIFDAEPGMLLTHPDSGAVIWRVRQTDLNVTRRAGRHQSAQLIVHLDKFDAGTAKDGSK